MKNFILILFLFPFFAIAQNNHAISQGPREVPGPGAGGAQDLINQKKIIIPPPDRGKFPLTQTCSDPKEGTLKPGDQGYGNCMDRRNGVEAEKNKSNSSAEPNKGKNKN